MAPPWRKHASDERGGLVSAFRGRSRRPAASDVSHPLDGLLRDVRELRLTLAADLHAAAAAAEDGEAEVASDIVEADRDEIARFRRVAETRLLRLPRARARRARRPGGARGG